MTATRFAPEGMVASVDHLASGAGLAMLRAGGSAADAAIAANAVLAATSPHLCGMGGDLFALVHRPGDDRPFALNASGRAGSGADAERLRAEGFLAMPFQGDLRTAPVPGCVDGWMALHDRFGRLPLDEILAPAAGYASAGFPASPLLALAATLLAEVAGAEDIARIRRAGDRVTRPGVAAALRAVGEHGRRGFYEGTFGRGLLAIGAGEYTEADLHQPLADWVDPLGVDVWGHRVWTIPPNSQGYLTLLGAAIASELPMPDDPADAGWAHLLVEAARAAGCDRPDILHEDAEVAPLLQPATVAARRARIDPDRRSSLVSPTSVGDTTYLCAVDRDRMAVSLIQSNASGFGTMVFEPATGIGLHNRGLGFSLEVGHPAEYGPGRRPPHTLSPALVTRLDGALRATVGTMGGDAQPQILLQVLARLLHHGQAPGDAVGAPRWVLAASGRSGFHTWADPDRVRVDVEDAGWFDGLAARGHQVKVVTGVSTTFGHAQVIDVGDMLAGAADPRAEVEAVAGY